MTPSLKGTIEQRLLSAIKQPTGPRGFRLVSTDDLADALHAIRTCREKNLGLERRLESRIKKGWIA